MRVVEDDPDAGDSLVRQLRSEKVDAVRVASASEALDALAKERFGCMILDLSLPDMDGLELLETLRQRFGTEIPPVVVYTGRALSRSEAQKLEAYAEAIVMKEGSSTERLMAEIRLFVRRLKEGMAPRHPVAPVLHPADVHLEGRKVLVVDDDMRTVYALSATLRAKGMEVLVADTGHGAISMLDERSDIEVVLMDIMMPEMDGYEATRRIRRDTRFRDLPIIALTAKAMKGDPEKCIEAGASDYLSKPIDAERLLGMLHAKLDRSLRHGA
jgi:CheY-like chemotaxis protein